MNPYVSGATAPHSPLMQHSTPYPQTTPQQAAQIQPGSITYTTTVGADGQVVYHPFKAVAASYQTPQGVVSGIQWIPAEATSVLPANATPADANFAASFGRRTDDRNWRDEDYRRRKDDASRGSNRYDRDRDRDRDRYDDDEYYQRQREREEREERDSYRRGTGDRDRERDRDRRMSGYGAGRYPGEYDKQQAADLERRMADLDLERREKDRMRERERERDRDDYYERDRVPRPRKGSVYGERPTSTYQPAPGGNYPGGAYSTTPSTYAAAPGGNYPPSAAYRAPSPRPGDVLPRPVSPYRNSVAAPRPSSPYAAPVAPRPISPYHAAGAIPRAASPYHSAGALPRAASPYHAAGAIPRAASPYQAGGIQRASSPYQAGGIQRAASPYGNPSPYGGAPMQRAASPYGGGGVPLRSASPYYGAGGGSGTYPPGHVLEGQAIGRAASPSPYAPPINLYANPNATSAASPYGAQAPYGAPYGGSGIGSHASPRVGSVPLDAAQQQQMLSVPEGFSRPPNRAHPYTQFEMIKIAEMDEFLEHTPRMPAVLMPHDVYHEDWIRLMTDLSMAWAGTMPVPQYSPDGRPPKRSTLAADVIDLWNASFFRTRGVEMILYKGRERRSGRLAGTVDMHLPGFDRFDVSSPSESEDTEDDDSAGERDRYRYGGGYSRSDPRRKERKAERRKRKMDKKVKKRMKELERTYTVYVQCVPPTVE